jgi:hypothetical protein
MWIQWRSGYYKLDMEVLFSEKPFEELTSDSFQLLQPNPPHRPGVCWPSLGLHTAA